MCLADLVESEKPDVVLIEFAERYLMSSTTAWNGRITLNLKVRRGKAPRPR